MAYPLCGILVTAIFGNQLPQYFSMAIPGSSQDTCPATLQWVVGRRVGVKHMETLKRIHKYNLENVCMLEHACTDFHKLRTYICYNRDFRDHSQLYIPRSPCAGSHCALSPAPAQPPASHGYKPAGSSPGHPTDIWRVSAAMCQVLQTNYPYSSSVYCIV